MRILWMSNAPWAKTGYGVQTRLFATRLHDLLGHDVAIHAFYGFEGGVMDWGGIRVYPKAYHPFGLDALDAHADDWKADLIITLLDVWVCDPRMIDGHWAPWFPIDCEPIPQKVLHSAQMSLQPLVFSRFGERMAGEAGLDVRYVPHGVDTQVFRPLDRAEARKQLGWPEDRFIVGMVAANKGYPSRKAFPQQLEAFARFWRRHTDALLYLHTTEGVYGEESGVNLPELVKALGIEKAVRFCDQYQNNLGYPDEQMGLMYSALDVLLSVSMGEGFGIPILEAQSCGCPVIVGDWTAMPELCFGGYMVPKREAEPWWTPLAAYQFVPHVAAVEAALETAYLEPEDERKAMRERARAGAKAYDADWVTMEYWKPVLEEIAGKVR